MTNWFTKMGLGVLAFGLLTVSPSNARAEDPCDPCDPCEFGDFELGVDFLYWKPCVDGLEYAVRTEDFKSESCESFLNYSRYKYKSLCPEWDPGVRVHFSMPDFWCDWTLRASWSYLDSSDSDKARVGSGAALLSPILHRSIDLESIDSVSAHWDLSYNDFDLLMSYDLCRRGCHTFSPFWGFAALFVDQEFKTTIRTSDGSLKEQEFARTKWDEDYFGFGFKIGSHWNYRFSDCMSFYANAWAALLAGERDGSISFKRVNGEVTCLSKVKDDDCCAFVPGYHIGAGLLYETCACDMEFAIRLGYEFTEWRNLSNSRSFFKEKDGRPHFGATDNHSRSIGVTGLVLGLQMGF